MSSTRSRIRDAATSAVMKIAHFNRDRMPGQGKPNPYLSGIHRPMERELTLENLAVTGVIPPELDGRYLRIGPNPLGKQNQAAYHWFVGDGMVHGVRIQNGKALWYRNRWVRTTEVSRALGEAPVPGPRNGGGEGGMVNTNVIPHAGKIWALVEANNYPVEIDEELETVAHNPFEGTLQGSFSAHPHRDPDTCELHAICYSVFDPKRIRHVVVGKDGKVRREEPIAVQHGPKIHECMITPRFVLVFDLPVTFSLGRVLAGQIFPYAWNAKHRARVGLLPINGRAADTMWCDVSPCHVFHACNAYDGPGGEVIVDVVVHDTMFAEKAQGPISKKVTFERWVVDPVVRRVTRQIIDGQPQEYPRMDERRVGKRYRYAYTTCVADHGLNFLSSTCLIKHDLKTRTNERHEFGEHRFPGEFVFVPKHAGAAEDEGWLMGFVVNEAEDTTDLAILDAQQFGAKPQALIRLPHRVPPGLHGSWVCAQ